MVQWYNLSQVLSRAEGVTIALNKSIVEINQWKSTDTG